MLLFSVQIFCIYCKSVWIGVVSHFIPSLLRFTTVRTVPSLRSPTTVTRKSYKNNAPIGSIWLLEQYFKVTSK